MRNIFEEINKRLLAVLLALSVFAVAAVSGC